MVRNEGNWEVRWTTTGLHPKLGEHQTFALRSDPPRRASVNERSGTDVLVPGSLYHFALDAKAAGAYLMTTATAVVDALRPFDDTLDPQRLAEQASSSEGPLSLITLRQSDRDQVAAVARQPARSWSSRPRPNCCPPTSISRLPSSTKSRRPWSTTSTARPVGESSSVNQNGVDVDVLNEVPAAPAPSVTISLDRAVQDAAQNAVNNVAGQQGDDRRDQAVDR